MQPGGTSPPVIAVTIVLLVLAGGISYWSVQPGIRTETGSIDVPGKEQTASGPLFQVQLPHVDPTIPPGPHRAVFVASCTTCHSPRLIFTQPHLNETQWTASVKKMIATYGAPIPPEEEKAIVTYLTSLPGQQEIR